MKKIFSFIIVLIMALNLAPSQGIAAPEDISPATKYGTNGKFIAPIDPPVAGSIAISNRAGLQAIADNLSGTYHLTADIDLSGADWVPIGANTELPFRGTFDGQGHVISDLTVKGDVQNAGLFGVAGEGATIKNVGMESTDINTTFSKDRGEVLL